MATSDDIAREVLALPEDRFYAYDEAMDLELTEAMAGREFQGVAIAAPSRVDPEQHDNIPVIVVSVESGKRQWEVDANRNRFLVAVDTATGKTYAGTVYPLPHGKRRGPAEVEPEPTGLMAEARITGTACYDLRKLVRLPATHGVYAVNLIQFDWVSNTLTVEVAGPDAPAPTAAAATPPGPDGDFPVFERVKPSPAPPAAGLALAPGTRTPGGPAPVFGSFRLPDPGPPAGDPPVMRITLVAAIKDSSTPLVLDLDVAGGREGGSILGFFAVDVAEQLGGGLPKGGAAVYAFSGAHRAGPVILAAR